MLELQLIDMRFCAYCKHYVQHYNKRGTAVNAGHCTEPRIKDRWPLTRACERYREKESTA